MKHIWKRVAVAALALLIGVFAFSGCSLTLNDQDTVVAVFGDEKIGLDTMKLYAYETQLDTEDVYEFMVLYYFGSYNELWKSDGMWTSNLNLSMLKLIQTKVLLAEAKETGLTLTAEETAKAEQAAVAMMETYPRLLEYSGATEAAVKAYFVDNALANKFRLTLIKDVDTNLNHDEYRRKKAEGVSITARTSVPKDETAETTSESEAETVSYTEEEQETNRKEAEWQIKAALMSGKTISEIIETYENDKKVTVSTISVSSISSSDAKTDDSADYTSYRQLAWDMVTDEVNSVTIESSGVKYTYVIRMIDDDDPEGRKSAEDAEITNREDKLFNEAYKELAKKYTKFHVYQDKLQSIRYQGAIKDKLSISTTTTSTEAE